MTKPALSFYYVLSYLYSTRYNLSYVAFFRHVMPSERSYMASECLPRRHGKRATPARQTCHAGVADVPCRRGKPLGRLLSRKGTSWKWLNALYCSLYAFSHFVNHFLRPSALSLPVSRVLLKLSSHSFAQPYAIVRSLGAKLHSVQASSATKESRREARSLSSCVF